MKTVKDSHGKEYKQSDNGTCYDIETPDEVINALECLDRDTRIRVWYGKDGVSWNEENDIIGYVGRSTGSIKIPLLIANKRSYGGGSLLTSRIVKIVNTRTKRVLYVHPSFKQSVFGADDTLVWDGEPGTGEHIYANCKTPEQAQRLAQFMNGTRMSK